MYILKVDHVSGDFVAGGSNYYVELDVKTAKNRVYDDLRNRIIRIVQDHYNRDIDYNKHSDKSYDVSVRTAMLHDKLQQAQSALDMATLFFSESINRACTIKIGNTELYYHIEKVEQE